MRRDLSPAKAEERIEQAVVSRDLPPEARHPAAFSVGAVVLAAKLAKSDGRVTKSEILAFRRAFIVPAEEERLVADLFDKARRDPSGYEPYAQELGRLFADEPELLEDLAEGLARIAFADGGLGARERDFLERVGACFRLSPARLEAVLARAGARQS